VKQMLHPLGVGIDQTPADREMRGPRVVDAYEISRISHFFPYERTQGRKLFSSRVNTVDADRNVKRNHGVSPQALKIDRRAGCGLNARTNHDRVHRSFARWFEDRSQPPRCNWIEPYSGDGTLPLKARPTQCSAKVLFAGQLKRRNPGTSSTAGILENELPRWTCHRCAAIHLKVNIRSECVAVNPRQFIVRTASALIVPANRPRQRTPDQAISTSLEQRLHESPEAFIAVRA
jgi:hypothetical protein